VERKKKKKKQRMTSTLPWSHAGSDHTCAGARNVGRGGGGGTAPTGYWSSWALGDRACVSWKQMEMDLVDVGKCELVEERER
jgi:hypothetical protein